MGQRRGGRLVHWRDMHQRAGEILAELEVDIDPRARRLAAHRRRPAGGRDRQGDVPRRPRADHGRADRGAVGARGASACSARSAGWPASGVAILFVSHRLDEVFELSDRITVLRDGQHISTKPAAEVTEVTLIRDMVGRELADFFHRVAHEPGDVALERRGPRSRGRVRGRQLRGARRARCSASPASSARDAPRSPRRCSASRRPTPAIDPARRRGRRHPIARATAMAHGIAYVSEDRRRLGLSLPQSVTANITLAGLRRFVVPLAARRPRTPSGAPPTCYRQRLGIRTPSLSDARRQPLGRQPAEGDARQVARRRSRRC